MDMFEFISSLILFALTLVVIYGVRRGLYWVSGRIYGYLPEILDERITPLSMQDTDVSQRLLTTLLDPVLSWFAVLFTMMSFLLTEIVTISGTNLLLQALVLYLCLFAGFIFPWQLFRRIFQWVSSHFKNITEPLRPILGVFSLLSALIIYYSVFFLILFSGGPFIRSLYNLFDPAMQTLAKQLFIQHVEAFNPVLGFGLIYIVYDFVTYCIRQKT